MSEVAARGCASNKRRLDLEIAAILSAESDPSNLKAPSYSKNVDGHDKHFLFSDTAEQKYISRSFPSSCVGYTYRFVLCFISKSLGQGIAIVLC